MEASVIIPVHNQFTSLLQVLKGFSSQNRNEITFELIIVDDGSTDELMNKDAH